MRVAIVGAGNVGATFAYALLLSGLAAEIVLVDVNRAEGEAMDQSTVLSVSSLIEDYYGINDVCLSLPTVVDRGGAEQVLWLDLSPKEIEGLRQSAQVLRATLAQLDLEGT
jgi:malate/lactate dehydrogenase